MAVGQIIQGGRTVVGDMQATLSPAGVTRLGGTILKGWGDALSPEAPDDRVRGGQAQPCPFGLTQENPPGHDPAQWGGYRNLRGDAAGAVTGAGVPYYAHATFPGPWEQWPEGARWQCSNGVQGAVRGRRVIYILPDGSRYEGPAQQGVGYQQMQQVRGAAAQGGANVPPPPPPPDHQRNPSPQGQIAQQGEPQTTGGWIVIGVGLAAFAAGAWALNKYT